MSRKNFIPAAVALCAVTGVYLYQYRDWFRKAHIQIAHSFRPLGLDHLPKPGAPPLLNSVLFRMDHDYRLTSVKIVPIPALETNKFAHPVWELNSDSNSLPLQTFAYGQGIRGMHSAAKGANAEPLETNIPYRLIVKAGSIQGQHDFTITGDDNVVQ